LAHRAGRLDAGGQSQKRSMRWCRRDAVFVEQAARRHASDGSDSSSR